MDSPAPPPKQSIQPVNAHTGNAQTGGGSIKGRAATGFASPADDFLDDPIDLNRLFIQNREATFLIRAIGASICRFGVQRGDILIVDRSLKPIGGGLVIGVQHGQTGLVRLITSGPHLVAVNSDHPRARQAAMVDDTFQVWGVVSAFVHRVRGE
jgi:DNA polymerase V